MKKNKLINLRVSESRHEEYMKLASSRGIKLSELIRELLEREVKEYGNK